MYQQTSRPSGSQRDEGQQVKIPLGQQLFGSLFLRARMVRKKKRENDNCQHTESEHAIIFLNMFTSEYSKKFLLDCIGLQISEIKRMHLEHTPLRIFYGFLPSSIRFFFTDFLRISAGQLTDFLRIFYGFLPGSLRICYDFTFLTTACLSLVNGIARIQCENRQETQESPIQESLVTSCPQPF